MLAFRKQRLPFLGLLLAALTGILLAAAVTWPSGIFLALCGIFLVAGVLPLRGPWILASVACAFACVQVWQTRESSSESLARILGNRTLLVEARGRVISDPAPSGTTRERFTMQIASLERGGRIMKISAPAVVVMPSPAPARGDEIRITGSLQTIPPPRNPGEFDAKAWMARNGISCRIDVASARDAAITRPAPRLSLVGLASQYRQWMEETLRIGIADAPVVCDFLAGMVLGVTREIPDSLQREFRNTGTFHLFSVSGLHVGMIGLILWQALKTARVGRRWAVAVIIPTLFFYALITGWKPSSLRAAVMAAIFLIGLTSSRCPVPLNSLCAAAFLILVERTNEIFNPGFQLSFLVVAAILLLAGPMHDFIRKHCHPDPFVPRPLWSGWQKGAAATVEGVGGLTAVSLAAWAGSLPLTIWYFHIISFSALPTNLLIVPLAFVIMTTAVLALLGGLLWSPLAAIFNNANWAFSNLLLGIVHFMAGLPGSYVSVAPPAPAPVVVTVFDFGAGGGAGIEAGGRIWLLDCGSQWQAGSVVLPWLRSRGKSAPDGLILTHGDTRHLGGAADIVSNAPPAVLVESVLDDRSPQRDRLHKWLAEHNLPKSLHRAGDMIRISPDVTLRVLYPPSGIRRDVADDKTLVVRLDAGSTRILFISDSGPATIMWLLENAPAELPAQILVKGSHSSGIPMDTSFVEAVHPELLIATSAGFPETERLNPHWVQTIEARGVRVFGQDKLGAVTITIRPDGFQATGFVQPETFPPEGARAITPMICGNPFCGFADPFCLVLSGRGEARGEAPDVGLALRGTKRDAQPGGPAGDGRIPDRGHEESGGEQVGGGRHSDGFRTEDDRHNRALRHRQGERFGERADVFPEAADPAPALVGIQKLDGTGGSGGHRGRRRGRVDEAPRAVDQELAQQPGSGDIGPVRTERLAEGSHLDLDPALNADVLGEPASARAQHPNPVRLIQKEPGPKSILQLHDLPQRGRVAIHAVNRLRHDQHAAAGMLLPRPAQMALQAIQIIVRKHPDLRAAQPGGIDQAGVAKLVEDHHIVARADRRDRPHRRRVAAREAQGGLRTFERRQRGLQALVRGKRPTDKPRCARAEPGFFALPDRRLPEGRMVRQPEVVVRGKIDQRTPVGDDMRLLRGIQNPQPAEESGGLGAGELALQKFRPSGRGSCWRLRAHRSERNISHMSRTACARPTLTARATMECPMFSSSSPARPRIAAVFR